jgi:hypothetical protein
MFDLLVAALPEKHLSQVKHHHQGHPCLQRLRGPQAQALGVPRAVRPGEDGRAFPAGSPR